MGNPAYRLLAEKTGLSVSTVEDLLRSGWTYQEKIGKPSRWLDPSAELRAKN